MTPAVRFIVRADFTIPGQHIVLTGGSPVVGDWVLTAGPPLCTDQSIFPIWTTEPVDLDGVALPLTYKYVVAPEVHDGVGGVSWEVDDTATVRTLTVEDVAAVQATTGGDVIVVDDGWFGVLPRAPVGGATASGVANGHAAATVAAPSNGVVDWAVHTPTAGKLREAVAKTKPTPAGSDKGAVSTAMGVGQSKEGAEHGKGPLKQVGLAIGSVFSNAHDEKRATHDKTTSKDGRAVVERTDDATGGSMGTTATGRSTAASADESSFNVRGGSTGHATGGTRTTTITGTWSFQSSGGGSSGGGGDEVGSSAAGAGDQGSTVVVESKNPKTGSTDAAEAAGNAAGNVASSVVSAVKDSAESAKQSAASALDVAKAAAADAREAADGALGDARSTAKVLTSSAKDSAAATWDAAKRTAEPVKATVESAKASLASARCDSDVTAANSCDAPSSTFAKKAVTGVEESRVASLPAEPSATSKMQRAVVGYNKAAADSAGATKAVAGATDTEKAVEGAADAIEVAGDDWSSKASATKTKTMTAFKTHQAAADSKAKVPVTLAADAKKVGGSTHSKQVVAGDEASMEAGATKVLPKAETTWQPTVTDAKEADTGLTDFKTSCSTSKTASTTGATASTTTALRSQHVTTTDRANLGSTDAEQAVAVYEDSKQTTAAKLHQAAADARSAVTGSSRPKKFVTWSVTSGARTAGERSTVDAEPVTPGPATGAATPPHGSQRQSSSKSTHISRSSVSSVRSFTRSSQVSAPSSSSAAPLPIKTPMSGTSTASFFSTSFSSSHDNKGAGLWPMPAGKGGGLPTVTETVEVWEVDNVARAVLPASAISPVTGGAVADAAGTLERLAADGDDFLTPPSVVVPFGIYTAAVAAASRSATATKSLANLSVAYETAAAGDDAAAAAAEARAWIESSTTVPRGAMAFIQAAFPRGAALLLYPSGNDSAADGGAALYGPPVAVATNDPEAVAHAVRQVWGSLWSPAAAAARAASGVPHERAAMAVLVQAVVPVDALFVAAARSPGSVIELEVAAGESADSAPFRGIVGADGVVKEEAVDTGKPAAARVEPPRPLIRDKSVAARLRRDTAYRAAVFRRIGAVVAILEGALGAPQVLQGALHGEGELYVVHARSASNV